LGELDQPEELALLPEVGGSLTSDLRAASERLHISTEHSHSAAGHRALAVVLCALHDPRCETEATLAVSLEPGSAVALLVRSRVRRGMGDGAGALRDVESALALSAGDARLLELRGRLRTEAGEPEAGLADLDRATAGGARPALQIARGRALLLLGREEAALRAFTLAVELDSEDPNAYLERAEALIRSRRPGQALVDVERAADWATDNRVLLARSIALYTRILPVRPDRVSRWLMFHGRFWTASIGRPGTSP
jgi:tetratricopeptide (TPR) repeat protein